MKYPFDAEEVITFVESRTGKKLDDNQKSMYRTAIIPVANNLTEFDDKAHVSEIPLLHFDPTDIKCKYPNLYAEYIATGCHIDRLSESAGVTKELMKAVFAGKAELTWPELKHAYHLFFCFSDIKYVYGYISSPKLSLVIPDTNKTAYRMKLLCDAVRTVDKLTNSGETLYWLDREQLDQAREVINQVYNQKKAVPLAFYRCALYHMQFRIQCLQPAKQPRGLNKDMALYAG